MRKSKKIISLLLALIMTLSVFTIVPFTASAAKAELIGTGIRNNSGNGDFEYSIRDDGTAQIVEYVGNETVLSIPSEVDGYVVTSIRWNSFYGKTNITEITIPDSVTSIEHNAFANCTSLTNVFLGESVKSIGSYAFYNCPKLKSVIIPVNVKSIDDYAFGYYQDKGGYSVKVEEFTLYGYDKTAAKRYASYYNFVFILLDNEENAYSYNVKEDGTAEILSYHGALTDIEIPAVIDGKTVTSIAECAFQDYTKLTSVILPDSIRYIGLQAFYGCSSLKSINIPDSVTGIERDLFRDCSSLTDISIGKGVTYIDSGAFENCTGLSTVSLDDNITEIGSYAFFHCTSLTSLTIPLKVASIGDFAFSECSGLEKIFISAGVTSIGDMAFIGCAGLTSITVDESNPKYDSRDDCDAIIETETNTLLVGCSATAIPYSVAEIGAHAFHGCANLKSITIHQNVISINRMAFRECTSLKSVAIPWGVTTISSYAFEGCSGLTDVSIGNDVEYIGDCAFLNCVSLKSIRIPKTVTEISGLAFGYRYIEEIGDYEMINGFTVYGYKYSEAERYANDRGFRFVALDDEPDYPLPTGGPYFYGDYIYYIMEDGTADIFSYEGKESYIIVPGSIAGHRVSGISDHAYDLNENLTTVIISTGIESISGRVFENCPNLTKITIPASVKYIDHAAFYKSGGVITIYGYAGSEAERFAYVHRHPFVVIDQPSYNYKDDKTGITVATTEEAVLEVDSLDPKNFSVPDIMIVNKAFYIQLKKNGVDIQPQESITISIPCEDPESKVYRVDVENGLTEMNAIYKDGSMVFSADCGNVFLLTVSNSENNKVFHGDVDGDGVVTILDATTIQRYLASIPTAAYNEEAADVDGDDSVTIIDATWIQRHLAQLPAPDGIGKPIS